jgi:uncharacterized protein (TIGR00730 family)
MNRIYSVAVFCGSRMGAQPGFAEAAAALGTGLAHAGMRLVYGGGRIGLMGALADAALAAGGQVLGVIPQFLQSWEVAHRGVSDMIVTDSMHARKQRMAEVADSFVMLPGGLGTFDETLEIITWRQLGLHAKPVLLCDIAGSAAPMVGLMDGAIAHGFASPEIRAYFERQEGVAATLARLSELAEEHPGPLAGNLPGA